VYKLEKTVNSHLNKKKLQGIFVNISNFRIFFFSKLTLVILKHVIKLSHKYYSKLTYIICNPYLIISLDFQI